MKQIVETIVADEIMVLRLPRAEKEVVPGICWGKFDELFTPAYWAAQSWIQDQNSCVLSHRLGSTLTEEITVCLLGGFGMPADLGLAAYHRVRDAGLLVGSAPSEKTIYELLSRPMNVGGRKRRYRYPKQRSRYLAAALERLKTEQPPRSDDLAFRDWLLTFSGIGPKTASWVTRNWLNSNDVAIIDIHIQRAGILAGFFYMEEDVGRSYFNMEKRFLEFSRSIGVAAAKLDDLMWKHMRSMNQLAICRLNRLSQAA